MAGEPAAKRYAQALLEIGVDHHNYEQLRDQLDDIADLYELSKAFRTALLNPSIELDERRQVIRTLAAKRGWVEHIINFGLLLLDNDRFRIVPTIAEEFGRLVDAKSGDVRAHVTSAVALSGAQKQRMETALGKLTGKNVLLDTRVDASLLGGAVTRIGSTVYDGSVKHQIDQMRDSILAEV